MAAGTSWFTNLESTRESPRPDKLMQIMNWVAEVATARIRVLLGIAHVLFPDTL
jgi:hypothetical protein